MIDIVGAGAMGLLFAAKCLSSSSPVRIWTRSEEQARLLREEGLYVEELNGQLKHEHQIYAYPLIEARERLQAENKYVEKLALFVKQTHWTPQLLNMLGELPAEADRTVVCFQNGIGHLKRLSPFLPPDQLITAVTTEASKRVSPNRIAHTGSGSTWLGFERDHDILWTDSAEEWINVLNGAGIPTFVSNNIDEMVYQKLLINAVINPLTALLRIRNGELLASEQRVQLMRDVYEEVKEIYAAKSILLLEQHWQTILQVCERTAMNTSSMLADVIHQRPTEIEAITGELLKLADDYDIEAPVQRSLYRLIKALDPI